MGRTFVGSGVLQAALGDVPSLDGLVDRARDEAIATVLVHGPRRAPHGVFVRVRLVREGAELHRGEGSRIRIRDEREAVEAPRRVRRGNEPRAPRQRDRPGGKLTCGRPSEARKMFFLGGKVSEALVRSERGVRSFFNIFILIDHRTNKSGICRPGRVPREGKMLNRPGRCRARIARASVDATPRPCRVEMPRDR